VDSILYHPLFQQNRDDYPNSSDEWDRELKQVLEWIKTASTESQLRRAGVLLKPDLIQRLLTSTVDWSIPEKLIKVLALTQSTEQAMSLLNSLMEQDPRYIPPEMAFTPVLTALRQGGEDGSGGPPSKKILDLLTRLTIRLAHLPTQQPSQSQQTLSIMSWNIYLAALCDDYEDPESLQTAADWVLNFHTTRSTTDFPGGVPPPDITSFNTILHGAAKARNMTMVETVWKGLVQPSELSAPTTNKTHMVLLRPDIRSYNARILATSSYSQRINIWNELMTGRDKYNISPDRYTLDLMLLPLLQERPNELRSLLHTFVENQSDLVLRDVLAAFMTTLVNDGKVMEARQYIFDPYLLPCLSSRNNNNIKSKSLSVFDDMVDCTKRIETRHFNILMDGYRQQAAQASKMAASKVVAMTLTISLDARIGQGDDESKESLLEQVQELTKREKDYRHEGRRLFEIMNQSNNSVVSPDSYTLTSMMGLLETPEQILHIWTTSTQPNYSRSIRSPAVIRAAITAAGRLGDAPLACAIFDAYHPTERQPHDNDPRLWNVLLGALEDCAEQDNGVVDALSNATRSFQTWWQLHDKMGHSSSDIFLQSTLSILQGKTPTQAVQEVLYDMESRGVTPNWQTYCSAAAALQYDTNAGPDLAMSLFRNASKHGISAGADGRFINAILRCFGDDIDQAIAYWKSDLRSACVVYESRPRPLSTKRATNKNLIAAYNGLMHVCGRAERPDIGVRLAYAMNREGIEPNEMTLNNYRAGKRLRKKRNRTENAIDEKPPRGSLGLISSWSKLETTKQYESLLYVECTKYDQYNKRMAKDRRVRIIV
jgi:pentatricopeptide repeat protein